MKEDDNISLASKSIIRWGRKSGQLITGRQRAVLKQRVKGPAPKRSRR